MEQEFREVWQGLTSPSTTSSARPSRGTARPSSGWSSVSDARRHLRRLLRGLLLRRLRGVHAGEGPRRRQLPHPPDEARVDPREELLLPALEVPAAAAATLRGAPRVPPAGDPAERDPAALESGLARHLRQPRGAGVGHPAPVRPGQRRLRLVRRADQLPGGGRLRHRRGTVREVVARRPAHRRQGHHAVPLRHLARDADERRAPRCRSRCSGTAGCT